MSSSSPLIAPSVAADADGTHNSRLVKQLS
jgi:hypothetical protein